MTPLHHPQSNHLLASLPPADFAVLAGDLELVPMRLGDILCAAGIELGHAYFPTTAIISLHYVLEGGQSSEIAGVGNEGMLGVPLFMGGASTPSHAMVQTGGHGYRLAAPLLLQHFRHLPAMRRRLLLYTQVLITQISQTAVCNRHHSLYQQLCCWLLLVADRRPGRELAMTQDLIANTLGVRREGVTEAARKLQASGLIGYRRGHITVLDRQGLEHQACECYAIVRREITRLTHPTLAAAPA